MNAVTESKKAGRKPLYALLGVFVLPMLVAYILYCGRDHIKLGHVNHGALMSAPFKKIETNHHWQIVHVTGKACDISCQKLDHNLHQIWKLLGKNQSRVGVRAEQSLAGLAMGSVYLADPAGNVFMHYAKEASPMDILKDLKRLLEVSQIG